MHSTYPQVRKTSTQIKGLGYMGETLMCVTEPEKIDYVGIGIKIRFIDGYYIYTVDFPFQPGLHFQSANT